MFGFMRDFYEVLVRQSSVGRISQVRNNMPTFVPGMLVFHESIGVAIWEEGTQFREGPTSHGGTSWSCTTRGTHDSAGKYDQLGPFNSRPQQYYD